LSITFSHGKSTKEYTQDSETLEPAICCAG
jgi:hypothetical protein